MSGIRPPIPRDSFIMNAVTNFDVYDLKETILIHLKPYTEYVRSYQFWTVFSNNNHSSTFVHEMKIYHSLQDFELHNYYRTYGKFLYTNHYCV